MVFYFILQPPIWVLWRNRLYSLTSLLFIPTCRGKLVYEIPYLASRSSFLNPKSNRGYQLGWSRKVMKYPYCNLKTSNSLTVTPSPIKTNALCAASPHFHGTIRQKIQSSQTRLATRRIHALTEYSALGARMAALKSREPHDLTLRKYCKCRTYSKQSYS